VEVGKKSFAPLLNVLVMFKIFLVTSSTGRGGAMSDTQEMPAGEIGGAAVRAGARRGGRGTRRNLRAKSTCFSPVLSGGWIGAPQPQREIGSN
jgi:hypothetical protein